MKTALSSLALLFALAGATTAQAGDRRPTLGFGIRTRIVSASTDRLDSRGLGISFALLRGQLRLEPEVGFAWSDRALLAGDGLFTGDSTWVSRTFTVGTGAFYELARGETIVAYAGGRLTLDFAEQTRILGSSSDWATGGTLAAVLGGEYFLAPLASVGLEAQVGVSVVSNKEASSRPDSQSAETAALLLFRFYVP